MKKGRRQEVTGTSDKLPIEAQLQMMRQMLPDAKKLGIMYTTSEANSVSAIEEYEKLSGDYGFQLRPKELRQPQTFRWQQMNC